MVHIYQAGIDCRIPDQMNLDKTQQRISPWVSRNLCTRWATGSDAIIEGFPSEKNSSVQVGPTNFKHLGAGWANDVVQVGP